MTLLILGLVLFLGVHSVRVVAEPLRSGFIARHGDKAWKGLYSLISLAGFVLLIVGYGQARQSPVPLWTPIPGMAHLAALLTLVAFVLIAAGNAPANAIRARLRHPMTLGAKLWAFAHLLANHTLADLLLFGGFLASSIAVYTAARRRDRAAGTTYPPGRAAPTAIAVVVGVVAWVVFALWLHAWWIGVRPFG